MLKPCSLKSGFILSTCGSLLGKAVAFFVNPLFALYFGAGHATDVYFFCVSTCAFGSAFITSLNSSVVIPEAMHLEAGSGKLAAQKFLNAVLLFYALTAGAIAIIVAIAPIESCALLSRFSVGDLQHLASLIRPFSLVFLFSTIATALSDILFAQRYFAVPTFIGQIPSCLTLISLMIFHRLTGVSCAPIALGIAYALQFVLLLALLRHGCKWHFTVLQLRISGRLLRNIALGYLGNITSTINSYIPYFLLSGFTPGTITAFNFAQSVASVPTTVLTSQVSGVLGIRFNELAAQRKFSAIDSLFRRASRDLHYVLVPGACILVLFGREIMQVLYGRPNVSTSTLILAAGFLKLLACMIPLNVVNTLAARVLMAERKVKISVAYQTAFSGVLFLLLLISVRFFGPLGYPGALVIAYSFSLIGLVPILQRTCGYLIYGTVLKDLSIIVSVNLAISAVLAYGRRYFRPDSDLLIPILGCIIYGCALLLLTYVRSFKEMRTPRKLLRVSPELEPS